MSSLVLARKYRPRHFGAMVGQEHVVQALANALTQGRLHHAYLFTGTRGVGKTTVSRILAKSLNCTGSDGQGGITAQPCGVCPACRDIDAGRYVDYVELDAASNRGVEEISTLLEQAVYKPVLGRFKVYMIDEVHMLSNHAFNAMLKTLEEPPDYLKFVLATTDPQKVPPTVLSRCLQFNLRPMAAQTVFEHLGTVLAQEAIGAEPGALRLLARAARGSMRDALSLTDQAIAFGAGALSEAGVRQMLGAVDRAHVDRILRALARADGPALVGAADQVRRQGLSASATLEELAQTLQHMAVLQLAPKALDASDPDVATAERWAPAFEADELQLLYSLCLHGRADLALAPDEYSALVMVLLRMWAFRPAGKSPTAPPEELEPATALGNPGGALAPQLGRPGLNEASPLSSPVPASAQPQPAPLSPVVGAVPSRAESQEAAPQAVRGDVETVAEVTTAAQAEPARLKVREEPPPWLDAPPDLDEADQQALAAAPPGSRLVAAPQAALATAQALQTATDPGATQVAATETASIALEPEARAVLASALGTVWNDTVQALLEAGSISALVRELAWQAQCLQAPEPGAEQPLWRLRVERESLRQPAQVERLQAALSQHAGVRVQLRVEGGEVSDTPALRQQAERQRRQAQAEATILGDADIQAFLRQFPGSRIVPGSIRPA